MKKKTALVLSSFALLTSCNSNVSVSSTNSEIENTSTEIKSETNIESSSQEIIYNEKEEIILPLDIPSMTLNKTYFYKHETLTIDVKNAKNLDWVGLYPFTNEPSQGTSLKYKYVKGNQTISFPISDFSGTGRFSVYLCHNDGYDVFQKQDIYIRDGDDTNYGVSNASINSSKEDGLSKASIEITPSTDKEVTYILHWSVDGVRLPNYTPIKEIKVKDKEKFTIELNDGIVMPDIANEIEIEVLEGYSMPYYLPVDDTLKRHKSNYLYSFEVVTDLHISSSFPTHISHLKMVLFWLCH